MTRAWQTPHGARPNREEVPLSLGAVSKAELVAHRSYLIALSSRATAEHVPARCVKPSGRSLEPVSNVWPRGMIVPSEQSGGQNSAYRSGCQRNYTFFVATT